MEPGLQILLITAMVSLSVAFLTYSFATPRTMHLGGRLDPYEYRPAEARQQTLERPFSQRVAGIVIDWLAGLAERVTPSKVKQRAIQRLTAAGNPIGINTFLVLRVAMTFGLPVYQLSTYALSNSRLDLRGVALTVLLALIGSRLPDTWLGFKVAARQRAIEKALPDALDLTTVCVEAGFAFDAALAKVSEKTYGPLADELAQVIADMRVGKLRREALKDLAARTGVPDLLTIVAAIVQADQMGLGIGHILRVQSDEMRVRRRQRAEEKAMKAPLKMLFPLVFCIFPALFIVILGPAVISIYLNMLS